MAYLYIAEIIKSLIKQTALKCGSVILCLVYLARWLRRKISLAVMRMGNISSRVWLIDSQTVELLQAVANKGNIPLKNITGFNRLAGVWYVRLKNIGWLRTSDILQMAIEVYPQTEEVK